VIQSVININHAQHICYMTCNNVLCLNKYITIFYAKGNQDKSLLNLNSDTYMNSRLRDTITNYGFRIDTNACVLPDEKSGDCRLSDLSRTILCPVSISLLQSWPKGIKAQSIPNDTASLRVQYLLAIAYNIVVH
jgi:hypothetical protein